VFVYQIAQGSSVLFLNGEEISDEEFVEWDDAQDAKEDAAWHPFDAETIAEDFAVAWDSHFRGA